LRRVAPLTADQHVPEIRLLTVESYIGYIDPQVLVELLDSDQSGALSRAPWLRALLQSGEAMIESRIEVSQRGFGEMECGGRALEITSHVRPGPQPPGVYESSERNNRRRRR